MPTLVALQPFTYATRSLQPGDTFEATDMHAQLLKLIGRAADGIIRDVEAAPPATPGGKRRYRRRDLRAEP